MTASTAIRPYAAANGKGRHDSVSVMLPAGPVAPTDPFDRNRVLALLPPGERTWMRERLERVDARSGECLAESEQPYSHVYFPETSVASLVNPTDEGMVEVGTVGNEGVVGLSVFLGGDTFPARTIWQVRGQALRMPSALFMQGVETRPVLDRLLRRYAHAFLVQVAQTASCNRKHALEQRCARWLLMTHDRVMADTFGLTHQFLGFMLGVHRPGVTLAAQVLQRAGLISYTRGQITVVDREGLEASSCECYGVVRDHFTRALHDVGREARLPA